MSKVAESLKAIIDREGLDYLDTNAYDVYTELLKDEAADAKTARMILITLLAGTHKQKKHDAASFASYIQQECGLEASSADEIAGIYAELFNADNRKEWKGKSEKGFREFCEKTWHYKLESSARWIHDYVYIDSDCTMEVEIEVSDKDTLHKVLEKVLNKNPFTTAKAIYDLLETDFQKMLDEDFDEYCTADDYYPPVAEDYVCDGNGKVLVDNFCAKYGLKVITLDYEGRSDDCYQPLE